MRLEDLDILRCPFCGGRLREQATVSREIVQDQLQTGLLGCACCAYPVVAGIPYLRTGQTARAALRLLDEGQRDQALRVLLGLNETRAGQFETLCRQQSPLTYRSCLEVFSPNLEGTYFLYRFSDPTFLVSDGLVRVLGQDQRCLGGRVLDLCGGSGHLTRTLCEISQSKDVWLADLEFWKLWLAQQFIVPKCHTVCCDAAQPLPFARSSFSLTICSDALHYIWPRRLLAGEMRRLVGSNGVVVATQLHNALCENPSEGSPLEPAAWRALFEEVPARLFKESTVLQALLAGNPIPLSLENNDAELATEPALIAISTPFQGLFRDYVFPQIDPLLRRPTINPLYVCEELEAKNVLTLQFASPHHEAEFEQCRSYLPARVELPAADMEKLRRNALEGPLLELARRHVILDLPQHYI